MKKIFLLACLVVSSSIYSQELDEAYLQSLPESVREDVLNKIEATDELDKPVYRRASTFIDKDKEKNKGEDKSLFGSNFFDVMQTSFMPVNEPNLDSSYILDFGDVLEIQLIGQKDQIDNYSINRDGSINLPDIGRLNLSGLSLNDASNLIKAKVNSSFIGTEAYISLKNIRDINVLIVGNAYNPGIYTLNGNSNMLHAISMAGGINDIGSYRNINLIRSGKVIDSLDIYEVLVFGKYNFSSGLRSGDSIVVGPREKIVSIESGVMRPSTFEIKSNETFDDLLKFANGFSKDINLDQLLVKRVSGGKSDIINLTIDEIQSFEFINNDSIFIQEYKIDTVLILGSVNNPGRYKLTKGTTLSEAIKKSGGYDSSAYPFGGYLENKNALEINKISKGRLYDTFLTNLITNSGASSSMQDSGISEILLQLKNSESTGRVIAEFDLDIISNDSSKDTILEDGDKIFIPQLTQQVYIQGEVSNSGAIRYAPGKDIDYYINKSGGTLLTADVNNIFIVHPNGETENFANKSRLSFILEDDSKELIYPGSIIYIPQKTNFANSLQIASIWAPIISSIALSLTSLSVLNNSN
ncbi:SLBB domain-containing protein [Gammaproteobacteria bacterium]|nr:SLBB domain-containing protein [Gammaproteobacteria bacterium]